MMAGESAPDGEKTSKARKGSSQGSSRFGARPPDVLELSRIEDRVSFAYFEHCRVSCDENAIEILDAEGIIRLPAASIGLLILGPGSTMTHKAMMTIGDHGVSVVWVGERCVRMYSFCSPLTHSSALLQLQAKLVSNERSRLSVARKMYGMRFPGEDVSKLTMQQLRGREGARIRRVYKELAESEGVAWDGRFYDPNDFDTSTPINKALSSANSCLYGVSHAVICALGLSAGLGFVHTGHERSFVYDIADLYKAELSIPIAFKCAAVPSDDIGSDVRHAMRDAMYDLSIIKRMVKDIKSLLIETYAEDGPDTSVGLWDNKEGVVPSGRQYAEPEG